MKTITETNYFDTGALIKAYCKKKRIHKAALARKTGIPYPSLLRFMKINTIDFNKLVTLCHGLGHNFLLDMAMQLPATYTTDALLTPTKDEEITQLKEQVKALQTEKELLLTMMNK